MMSGQTAVTEPKKAEPERPGSKSLLLRARFLAIFACVVGAGASLVFMYQVGHRNPSVVLLLLFTVWVLSPFVALLVGAFVSASWAAPSRAALHGVMIAVSVVSPAVYGVVALGPPRPKPAFAFLVVPLAAWCLGAGALAFVSFIGGGSHDPHPRA
jgi:hypothetical protein